MQATRISVILAAFAVFASSCFYSSPFSDPQSIGPELAMIAIFQRGGGAVSDPETFAPAGGVTLPAPVGSPVTVDETGNGKADGLDYSGDGSPDALLIDTDSDGVLDGVDTDGDGNADAYIGICEGEARLTTQKDCEGSTVTVIPGSGFDSNGDGVADDPFISDGAADATPPTMTSNVSTGTYPTAQNVTLTCNDTRPGSIVYTIDGSAPAFGSPPSGTIVHPPNVTLAVAAPVTTIRALCRDLAGNLSAAITRVITIADGVAPVVSFVSPAAGTYPSGQMFVMNCSDVGDGCGTLAYTTNGIDPQFNAAGVITVGSEYTGPTVIPDGATQVKIRAVDNAVPTPNVSAVVARSFNIGPPAAPGGVAASGGNGQATVSWNSVAGATTYTVYYSTSSPVTTADSPVSGIGATSQVISGLTNGVTYYFRVTATHSGGTSGLSAETSASPVDALIIFVTNGIFDGRMAPAAQLTDLDALCNADANKPNSSNYMAYVRDNRALVFSETYKRTDGTIIGATGPGPFLFLTDPLINPISATTLEAWTSDLGGGDDCNDWRTNAGGLFPHAGGVGDLSQTTRFQGWTNVRQVGCDELFPLICIEQP